MYVERMLTIGKGLYSARPAGVAAIENTAVDIRFCFEIVGNTAMAQLSSESPLRDTEAAASCTQQIVS